MTTKLYTPLYALKTLLRQLWLSLSSVDFYVDVYKHYKGYGIKYLFTLSFISSLIYCCLLLSYIVELRNFFLANEISKGTANLEYLIHQIPDLTYKNKKISLKEETPLYLFDNNNRKIAVLDPNNQLSFQERIKIPIIFTSSKILISFIWDKKHLNFPIDYSNIFGQEEKILSGEVIKQHFATILNNAPKIFIYLLMPTIIILSFILTIFQLSLAIILVYFMINFFGLKTSFQTCCRIMLFSSGVYTLMQPIINIFLPIFNGFTWLILLWANSLLLLALLKIKHGNA